MLRNQELRSSPLIGTLALAGLFVACHASQSIAADYNFGIIQAVVNPYYATWPQAAKDAAADFGIKVEIGSPQDFDQVH